MPGAFQCDVSRMEDIERFVADVGVYLRAR